MVAGMDIAEGDLLVVMDADLSHPPERLPALIAALDDPDVDFVIGSRYVDGGGTDEDWGLLRYLNSKFATWLARPLTPAKDPMAGFFGVRRKTLQACRGSLNPVGYKIGLELIVKGPCRTIAEVPIQFHDRVHGQSKLSFREQLNYLRHLKRLYEFRYRNFAYLAQFLAVGADRDVCRSRDLRSVAWMVVNRLGPRAGDLGRHDVQFCAESKVNLCLRWQGRGAFEIPRFLRKLFGRRACELVGQRHAVERFHVHGDSQTCRGGHR